MEIYKKYQPALQDVRAQFDMFRPVSEKIIIELQTKSCESNFIPPNMLKENIDRFLGVITELINLSLFQGVFPTKWKVAILRPMLKKLD